MSKIYKLSVLQGFFSLNLVEVVFVGIVFVGIVGIGVSKDITKDELNEISLNDTVYDFSVGHSSIRKEDT